MPGRHGFDLGLSVSGTVGLIRSAGQLLPKRLDVELVYTSTMRSARQSGVVLAASFAAPIFPPHCRFCPPHPGQGEFPLRVQSMVDFLTELHPEQSILVVTHGEVIAAVDEIVGGRGQPRLGFDTPRALLVRRKTLRSALTTEVLIE